jgi:hypothetical protein
LRKILQQDAEKVRQRRSRIVQVLNVGMPEGVFPFAKTYSMGERPARSAVCTSSGIHSLRPCWMAILSILRAVLARIPFLKS